MPAPFTWKGIAVIGTSDKKYYRDNLFGDIEYGEKEAYKKRNQIPEKIYPDIEGYASHGHRHSGDCGIDLQSYDPGPSNLRPFHE